MQGRICHSSHYTTSLRSGVSSGAAGPVHVCLEAPSSPSGTVEPARSPPDLQQSLLCTAELEHPPQVASHNRPHSSQVTENYWSQRPCMCLDRIKELWSVMIIGLALIIWLLVLFCENAAYILIIFLICTLGILTMIMQAITAPHIVMRVKHQRGKSVVIPRIPMGKVFSYAY